MQVKNLTTINPRYWQAIIVLLTAATNLAAHDLKLGYALVESGQFSVTSPRDEVAKTLQPGV